MAVDGGLLLSETVQRAEPPNEIDRVNADDLVLRHQLGERVHRDAVVLVVERRHEHRAVGDSNKGYHYISDSLTWTRVLIAAQALGIAQGALDQAVKYTSEREQFGETLSRFQMIRGKIADMATGIEAGRALLYRAAGSIDNGESEARALASMAKLFCSDTAMRVTTDAVQLHGGAGYLADFPVERMMRDAKITQIYEGVNEIQRLIIAKHVYG